MIGRAAGALAVLFLLVAPAAHACPSCAEGLGERWALGFLLSGLFIVSVPLGLAALVVGVLYHQHRRQRSDQAEGVGEHG